MGEVYHRQPYNRMVVKCPDRLLGRRGCGRITKIQALALPAGADGGDNLMSDANAGRKAGLKWGPFTLRIPFLQARGRWPEGLQGGLVARSASQSCY